MPSKIIYEVPQQDSSGTYNRHAVFKIQNYGLVKMLFLEFTVTGTGQTFTTPSAPYIIKDVSLESFGNPIGHVTTSYTLGRIDESQKDVYDQIVAGSTFTGLNLNGTQTVSMPLYLSLIDKQKLDARKFKNLTVSVRTKDSFVEMGFSGNVTLESVRLRVVYEDPKLYIESPIKHSYNVYRETIDITSENITPNANTQIIKINNPYIISNLYFMIRKANNGADKGLIRSIKLTYPNNEIGIYDIQTNYSLNSTDNANFGNTFAINIADRYIKGSDYFQPTGQNNPLIAEITYLVADAPAAYKLYVASEYYSELVEGPDGLLIEETPGSMVRF